MAIIDEIYKKQSAKQARHILDLVLYDAEALQELMDCFFSKDLRVCQAASWSVGMIAEKNQELLKPYLRKMIIGLNEPMHNAIVRNTLRSWQYIEIPEAFEGEVFEKCFTFLSSPSFPIAIRVFSMTVCFNISKKYPELLEELESQILQCLQEDGKGVISRAKQVLKDIKGIKSKLNYY